MNFICTVQKGIDAKPTRSRQLKQEAIASVEYVGGMNK